MNNETKCDFCETRLDEDEELTPMRIGDAPQPKPMRIEEIVEKDRNEARRSVQLRALIDVLEDHPQIDIEFHDFVETIEHTDVRSGATRTFESRYDHDKVGVGLRIRPDAREVTPDAMLCPVCVESFRNL